MSDSVDRVFVHALNTVKKIPRTGTARPPSAERLKLYGLYKQSMEGDVEGIMDRPIGDTPDVQAEREKWDAWYSQRGISRTEAKRRYITTLINTMHLYASQTAEARELVSELEFVWDQIKYNASSSSSSSPIHGNSHPAAVAAAVVVTPTVETSRRYGSIDNRMAMHHLRPPQIYQGQNDDDDDDDDLAIYRRRSGDSRLRVLSPVSQSDEVDVVRSNPADEENEYEDNDEDDDEEEEEEEEEDEFQEARDGTSFSGGSDTRTTSQQEDHTNPHDHNTDHRTRRKRQRKRTSHSTPISNNNNDDGDDDGDWRRRIEQALTKMTTEIAALREQIDSLPIPRRKTSSSSSSFSSRNTTTISTPILFIWSWTKWVLWNSLRQILWHCFVLLLILLWMRTRGDRRLEIRVRAIVRSVKNRIAVTRRFPTLSQIPSLP